MGCNYLFQSVLSPLLFLIDVNHVAENIILLCRLFADNKSFSTIYVIQQLLSIFYSIDKWPSKWILKSLPFTNLGTCFFIKNKIHSSPPSVSIFFIGIVNKTNKSCPEYVDKMAIIN